MIVTHEELCAWVYLACVTEPPAPAVATFVRLCEGPVDAARAIREGVAPRAVMAEAIRPRDTVVDDAMLGTAGVRVIVRGMDEWPAWAFRELRESDREPFALWVRGGASLNALCQSAVVVDGARASTSSGNELAGEFAEYFASNGITVVGGGSLGIAGAAHRSAVAHEGRTIAVLGNGLDVTYPAGHDGLFGQIVENGLLVSEYPPSTLPARHRFLARQRIGVGLGRATVLVEGGWRSGSLAMARTAHELGRRVYAVPGIPFSVMSQGTNELLRTGQAIFVTSADQVDVSVDQRQQ